MQKLTCEMCGGNDLVKQDGLYVCQHCGTKYSLEDSTASPTICMITITGS